MASKNLYLMKLHPRCSAYILVRIKIKVKPNIFYSSLKGELELRYSETFSHRLYVWFCVMEECTWNILSAVLQNSALADVANQPASIYLGVGDDQGCF